MKFIYQDFPVQTLKNLAIELISETPAALTEADKPVDSSNGLSITDADGTGSTSLNSLHNKSQHKQVIIMKLLFMLCATNLHHKILTNLVLETRTYVYITSKSTIKNHIKQNKAILFVIIY